MALFDKKDKISVDKMAMELMVYATEAVGDLKWFSNVDSNRFMAVSMGYFYGFTKIHFKNITSVDIANLIIEKSISNMEEALKGKEPIDNFGDIIRTYVYKSIDNMIFSQRELKSRPFYGLGTIYLADLYNTKKLKVTDSQLEVAEKNMIFLFEITKKLMKNKKIVK